MQIQILLMTSNDKHDYNAEKRKKINNTSDISDISDNSQMLTIID